MGRFSDKLKSNDMFGHTICLNFNKEGDAHKTAIGGFMSVFIRIAMAIYVYINFKKMIFNESDSNGTQSNTLDLEKHGEI